MSSDSRCSTTRCFTFCGRTRGDPEIFVDRCLFPQNHGFNVTVNLVAWPEQMYLIPSWAEMFHSHGQRFHVPPYLSISYYPYEYSPSERALLERWTWENHKAGLRVVKPEVSIKVLCSGGADHFNVQPDGSAWRRVFEQAVGHQPVGECARPGF